MAPTPMGSPSTLTRSAVDRARGWTQVHPHLVDAGLVAFTIGLATVAFLGSRERELGTVFAVLVVLGAGALLLRREHPLLAWAGATVTGVPAVLLSAEGQVGAGLATTFALYAVGLRASLATTVRAVLVSGIAYSLAIGQARGYFVSAQGDGEGLQLLGWGATAAAIGVAVRSHRSAVAAAEARAVQAEQTREEEAERRVTDERLRIARDLHDVVAHHISVVNVQAGVARHLLETRPEQARVALGLVREASRTVLSELAAVVGLLRSSDEGDAPREPAPGMAQLDRLTASVRAAGLDLTSTVAGQTEELRPINDLTAYRVVQEALTNALKYGTGTAELTVEHDREEVRITVRNHIGAAAGPVATDQVATGTGHGLIGMRERVAAVHGRLTAGPGTDGSFTVSAAIPRGQA